MLAKLLTEKSLSDPYILRSNALEFAWKGSLPHRDALALYYLRWVDLKDEDAKQNAFLLLLRILGSGYLIGKTETQARSYIAVSIFHLLSGSAQAEKAEQVFFENLKTEKEYIEYNDSNLQAVAQAVRELGTSRGAIQAAADSLGISRSALQRRLRRLPGAFEDYKKS